MRQNLSPHENFHDDEPIQAGSNRAFGCTVGTVLMAIGAAKALVAGAIIPGSFLIFGPGALLVTLGIVAPSRLTLLNRGWLKLGAAIAMVVNPVILALLFLVVITPMALVMRIAGKRPLRLAPDRTATTYWIACEPPEGGGSSMRRQF